MTRILGSLLGVLFVSTALHAQTLSFVSTAPCRVADTRAIGGFTGAFGPPSLVAGKTRAFAVQASSCKIPANAKAYSLNVTVVPVKSLTYITVWAVGSTQPNASTLNDYIGTTLANAAIIPAGNDASGSINVFASDTTDIFIDINGYFVSTPQWLTEDPACGKWVGGTGPYTLTYTPNPSGSLSLYLDGSRKVQGVDYTVTGNTVTWLVMPQVGNTFVCDYQY